MILDRILEHKRAEVRRKQSRGYLAELKGKIADRMPPLLFVLTLEATRKPTSPALIAEVKRASPSLGFLKEEFKDVFDPVAIAEQYRDHGASCLSVLTDEAFFHGSLQYLQSVKSKIGLPTLNKEFMVHEIQFYEARAHGADAVLLIVAALERRQLIDFYALARDLSLDVLIEINNRDLTTFMTDLNTTFRIMNRVPKDKVIVSESGIHTRDDVKRFIDTDIHAMLVGESLIRAKDIGAKVRELLGREQDASPRA
jgi:indole-3-glycerol phosphate synthase